MKKIIQYHITSSEACQNGMAVVEFMKKRMRETQKGLEYVFSIGFASVMGGGLGLLAGVFGQYFAWGVGITSLAFFLLVVVKRWAFFQRYKRAFHPDGFCTGDLTLILSPDHFVIQKSMKFEIKIYWVAVIGVKRKHDFWLLFVDTPLAYAVPREVEDFPAFVALAQKLS